MLDIAPLRALYMLRALVSGQVILDKSKTSVKVD